MKKLLVILSLIVLLATISIYNHKTSVLDISIHEVENIQIKRIKGEKMDVESSDWERLIDACNSIEEKDVDWEKTNNEPLFSAYITCLSIIFESEIMNINYGPWPVVGMKDQHYYVDLKHEIYDIFRELDLKYNTKYLDYEEFMDMQRGEVHGFADQLFTSCICAPYKSVNEALEWMKIDQHLDSDMTIQDILDTYDGEYYLNQVIEYENMSVKVIEIKEDNRVTAVIFSWN